MISLLVVLFQWFLPCVLVFCGFFAFVYPFYFLFQYCVLVYDLHIK